MVAVKVALQIDCVVYVREFFLPDSPEVGDEVTVWDHKKTSGIVTTVTKRCWNSCGKARLTLVCSTRAKITPELLTDAGWK